MLLYTAIFIGLSGQCTEDLAPAAPAFGVRQTVIEGGAVIYKCNSGWRFQTPSERFISCDPMTRTWFGRPGPCFPASQGRYPIVLKEGVSSKMMLIKMQYQVRNLNSLLLEVCCENTV